MRRVEAELDKMKELRETIDDVRRKDVKVVKNDGTPASSLRIKAEHTEQSTKLK